MSTHKDEKNGTWYVMVRYHDWKGVKRQKCKRGFATKREAQEWERNFQLQSDGDPDMTFEAFLELYEHDIRPRLKENTWLSKEHMIRTKIFPTFGKKMISEIETRDIIAWQNELLAYRDEKKHIHNHIILCATNLDGQQKYRDVKRSAKDLMQISDTLCEENGLSVIRNPQDKAVPYDKWEGNLKKSSHRDDLRIMIDAALRHRPVGFDALMQMLEDAGCCIKRGAHISLKLPNGQRYIRLKSLGPEYDENTLRQTLAGDHVHIPKTPRADYSKNQIKRLVDIEDKLRNGKGKGYQVWAERNNIDAISQTVIFLKEHHIGSLEELEKQIDDLQSACEEKKASIRQAQNRMKEINRQRQAIRDYRRTKEIYTQFKESGWSAKFYQEHRAEIEAHKKAQAVYELHDGKLPTLKELTAEYVALKEQLDAYKPDLAELKSKLTDLKHIRYNYKILIRDIPHTDQYYRKGDRIER